MIINLNIIVFSHFHLFLKLKNFNLIYINLFFYINLQKVEIYECLNRLFISGQHLIPKGAEVLVNIFAIHRNPKEYENPEAFNPDNFLPENIEKRHPCSYVPFAMGNRKCIGTY